MVAEIVECTELGPFSFRWPDGVEHFEGGWRALVRIENRTHEVVHRLGSRVVYGRERVHTVTWLDDQVAVEGVEADDYPVSSALLSLLKRGDKALLRSRSDVPTAYAPFDIVEHRREIDAPHSRRSLAVKIREDDVRQWALHAWLRRRLTSPGTTTVPSLNPLPLPDAPAPDRRAVVEALLRHGADLAEQLGGAPMQFTPDPDANHLIHSDPFAFVVAVVCDQGIPAERAWAAPLELRRRLGHLEPHRIAVEVDAVAAAFRTPPKLHRFVNTVPQWISDTASIIVTRYDGDAASLWSDRPTAAELRSRFDAFPGIGQKKAAMAVELLERYCGVALGDLSGSDIAYDVHVRRVFLRAGLAERDEMNHMVSVARLLHPERPGALDNPAWDIGRRWCRPAEPDCPSCPLVGACARLIQLGSAVRGV
jgi:uncharacterized HhH-GPD family protein